jgi:L-fucose isomerase-like protein
MIELPLVGFLPIQFIQEDKASSDLTDRAFSSLQHSGNVRLIRMDAVYSAKEARGAVRKCFAEDVDLVVYFIPTWIESSVVLAAVQEVKVPFAVWGCSDLATQSLLGAVEVVTSLNNLGEKVKAIYGDPHEREVIEEIEIRAKAARVLTKLKRARIGFIGGIAFGMYDAVHDLVALRERFGTEIVHLDQYRIIDEISRIPESEVQSMVAKVSKRVGRVQAPNEHMTKSVKIYLGLRKLIEKFGLDGILVKCHPDLSQIYGACACLSVSSLIDDGMPAACEGNLNTAFTMYILHELTGNPPFAHEISAIDRKDNTLMLWHCGAGATSLAADRADITIQQQYAGPVEKGGVTGGVTMDFWVKPGQTTTAALAGMGKNLRMQISEGEILEPRKMDLGSGKIWARALIKMPDVDAFIKNALGHQFVTIHGRVGKELNELCEMAGIPII